MNEQVDLYGMLRALETLARERWPQTSERIIAGAQESLCMAMGYVWGIEDAGTPSVTSAYGRDVNAYWEFAYMYAIVEIMFRMEQTWSRPSVHDAYQAFLAGIDLREYPPVGRQG